MNLLRLGALVVFSISLPLILGGAVLSSAILLEGVGVILDSQGSPLEGPMREVLTDTPAMTAAIVFCFLAIPGGIMAAAGMALGWLEKKRQRARPSKISRRRILLGQIAGLAALAIGLVPLLAAVPTAILASQTIPAQRQAGALPVAQHPLLFGILVLVILAVGPLGFGSGLLVLARRDQRAPGLQSLPPGTPDQERARRERWNLRLERICLLLGCGALLSLGTCSWAVFYQVTGEYLAGDQERSALERIALTPEGTLAKIFLFSIPALVLLFLILGLRTLLLRREPEPQGSAAD